MPPSPPWREASSEDEGDEEPEERRRKAVLLFLVAFLLALGAYGAVATPTEPIPTGLYEATGDLTVTVESQQGEPVAGKEVALVNPESGETVATGTTNKRGVVTFRNVERATFTIRVDGSTHEVTLASAEKELTMSVTVTPPKSYRSVTGSTDSEKRLTSAFP